MAKRSRVRFLAWRFTVGLLLGGIAALIAAGLGAAVLGGYSAEPGASPGAGDNDAGVGTVLVVLLFGAVVLALIIRLLRFLRRRFGLLNARLGTAPSRRKLTFVDWPPKTHRGDVPVGLSITALIVGMATGLGGLAIGLVTAW